jgi:PAS domain-containing protein
VICEALERQKRTFDLAMTASQMGTWRYTLADNICVYDENAQRLYGLTEARFAHDETGVKSKFHPDDLELMWSRVAEALDPRSEGRYNVEYRVRQLDGSWRWLSAWGLVPRGRRADKLRKRPVGCVSPSRNLYWPHSQRRTASRSARHAVDEVRVGDQPEGRQSARPHHHALDPRPCRRCDRIEWLMSVNDPKRSCPGMPHHLDRSKVRMLRVIPFSGQFGITRQGDNTFSRSPSSLKNRVCSEPTHSGFQATSTLVIHLSPSTR